MRVHGFVGVETYRTLFPTPSGNGLFRAPIFICWLSRLARSVGMRAADVRFDNEKGGQGIFPDGKGPNPTS